MRIRTTVCLGCALLFAACSGGGDAAGDLTADEILREAAQREQARSENVSAFRITQETAGTEQVLQFERRTADDGAYYYELVSAVMDGQRFPVDQIQTPGAAGSAQVYSALAGKAELREVVREDGRRIAVLVVPDPGEVDGLTDIAPPSGPEGSVDYEYQHLELRFDLEEYLLRSMESRIATTWEGEPRRLTMGLQLQEYQETDGLAYPHRVVMRVEGLPEPDAGEREEMRAQMQMMQTQLASIPEQHRAAAARFIGHQLRMMEQMMDGYVEFETVVRSLEVEHE